MLATNWTFAEQTKKKLTCYRHNTPIWWRHSKARIQLPDSWWAIYGIFHQMTVNLDLQTWQGQSESACQITRSKVTLFQSCCPDTQISTHTGSIALPEPVNGLVTNLGKIISTAEIITKYQCMYIKLTQSDCVQSQTVQQILILTDFWRAGRSDTFLRLIRCPVLEHHRTRHSLTLHRSR